jgi:biopolymer transport protein TolQ
MTPTTVHTHPGTWALIADAGPLVKFVLLLLLAASILTWAIIFTKARLIRDARAGNARFNAAFWESKTLDEVHQRLAEFGPSPVARTFEAGFQELRKIPLEARSEEGTPEISAIERALGRAHGLEIDELEKYVDWLASTASAAPFVGLFGTVWGIMNSFQNIGAMGSASLAVVAPGISEALIATAMGLAAAIPAAIAYNLLVNRTKRISLEVESFSREFLNMIQRQLLQSKGPRAHGTEPVSEN